MEAEQKRGRLRGAASSFVGYYLSYQNHSACARRQSAWRCSLRPNKMPKRTQAFRSPLSQSWWKPIISASAAFCAWAGDATIEADAPTPAAIIKAVINRLKVMGSPVKIYARPAGTAEIAKSECNPSLAEPGSNSTSVTADLRPASALRIRLRPRTMLIPGRKAQCLAKREGWRR